MHATEQITRHVKDQETRRYLKRARARYIRRNCKSLELAPMYNRYQGRAS
jgi:hypothetical protein